MSSEIRKFWEGELEFMKDCYEKFPRQMREDDCGEETIMLMESYWRKMVEHIEGILSSE